MSFVMIERSLRRGRAYSFPEVRSTLLRAHENALFKVLGHLSERAHYEAPDLAVIVEAVLERADVACRRVVILDIDRCGLEKEMAV